MSIAVRYGLPWGQVWGNDDASAEAVSLPPDGTDMSLTSMLRVGMGRLPLKGRTPRRHAVLRAMSATEPFHEAVDGPHW